MKQLKLFNEKVILEFGGSLNLGERKRQRPIFTQTPSHFVLKAEQHDILLKNKDLVEETIQRLAQKFNIKIYELAVQVDHAHIVNHVPNRESYNKWARSVTGVLSRKLGIKWRLRPYNCRVTWGRQLKAATNYVRQNRVEADFILEAHHRVDEWLAIAVKGMNWG
jgi:REP element-mobilizing transposase RayT